MIPAKMALVSASIVALAACQHTTPYGANSGSQESEGRVVVQGALRGPSAWFSADRVIGPTINMTREADGHWIGWIRGFALNLTVADGQISSPSLTMDIHELPDGVEISGLWVGGLKSQISIRVTPKELYVRGTPGPNTIYLEGIGEGSYGKSGFGSAVELQGAAAQLHPPQPQFALALLGAF